MTHLHIHAPPTEKFCRLNECPTCERMRRMLGEFAEWYGTTWTCLGCGDSWQDGERMERPFCPGWRRRSIESARKKITAIGCQA